MKKILFVCLGNICRSPLAEAVFLHLVEQAGLGDMQVDSAGTSGWHEGERADPRSREVAARHGVAVPSRSRPVRDSDFQEFDLILAMDGSNLQNLQAQCPSQHQHKLRLMRDWDPQGPGDVPDPYYGGPSGFDDNYAMLKRCCLALIEELAGSAASDKIA